MFVEFLLIQSSQRSIGGCGRPVWCDRCEISGRSIRLRFSEGWICRPLIYILVLQASPLFSIFIEGKISLCWKFFYNVIVHQLVLFPKSMDWKWGLMQDSPFTRVSKVDSRRVSLSWFLAFSQTIWTAQLAFLKQEPGFITQSFKYISPITASTTSRSVNFFGDTKRRYPPFGPWIISMNPDRASCWATLPKNWSGTSIAFAISLRVTTSPCSCVAR